MAEITPAAEYLRMSTEHQQYSLENQAAAIRKYADAHGFEVVRTCTSFTACLRWELRR